MLLEVAPVMEAESFPAGALLVPRSGAGWRGDGGDGDVVVGRQLRRVGDWAAA